MKCENCKDETQLIIAENYQYELSGLNNLVLENIQIEICENCDLAIPLIPKILKLHELIARALVAKPSLLSGEEIRFLRKTLRLKTQEWANFLRKDIATISRAEKAGQKINKDLDLLVRLAFIRLWEEKKGEIFPETLPVLKSADCGVSIDTNDLESFSYFDLEDLWQEKTSITVSEFDYSNDFGQSASFKGGLAVFGEPPSSISKDFYAKNREFALAG